MPEYIKSDIYFPGYIIEEEPHLSPVISKFVQSYIVDIGMPVIERWERCARSIWPMTQGKGGQVPPPYPSQPIQPHATPKGSSTFVYHGRPSSAHRVVDDEYEEEELTPSMMEILNVIDERDAYKSQVEQLRSELDNVQATLSTLDDSRRQYKDPPGYTSPSLRHTIAHPTTPIHDQYDRFSHISPTPSRRDFAYTSPSPSNRRLFSNALASPSHCEGSSVSDGSAPPPATHAMDSLAEYYNFLDRHNILHLRSTLDVIRHSSPISSWALQLEQAGVPLDLIDSVMTLMVGAAKLNA